MFALLNHGWRLLFTALSFIIFGMGGLVLGLVVFSLTHLLLPQKKAQRFCRYCVHLAFREFVRFMYLTGVLDYELKNTQNLRKSGQMIIANHPSLIDIIFIVAHIPDAYCVVKTAAWKNPFIGLTMLATGYIRNSSPAFFVDKCVEVLEGGGTLVLFPEGTRTKPGKPLKFLRGAALIALRADKTVIPVYIRLHPTTLTKGEPWYHVPTEKVRFYMCVGSAMAAEYIVEEKASYRKNARAMTTQLVAYFETKRKDELLYDGPYPGS